MIPKEILNHYNMETLEERIEFLQPQTEEQIAQITEKFYRQFLNVTDYEITRGYDKLLSEPLKFISNLTTLSSTLKSICEYREFARTEVKKYEEVSK